MEHQDFCQIMPIPGTDACLHITRTATGKLLSIEGGGRVYVSLQGDSHCFDQGMVTTSETIINQRLLRHVHTANDQWIERYVWDKDDRLTEIDGVSFCRDNHNRIISSTDSNNEGWRYRYNSHGPVSIQSPSMRRNLKWKDGILIGASEATRHQIFSYTDGVRNNVPALPENIHLDELGRVWAVTDDNNAIRSIFLWEGYACLARIDGALGEPLAAVYSLDPTGTPVRIITPNGVTRIPRDAFAEGLLAYPGNPGLFGGFVYHGYTYLPARIVDPRTGCFTTPDSFDGLINDPRRQSGFKGTLLKEHESVNPYAVAQYDAVARTDPTGNISAWVIISDFTWSLQNNLLGWFGLDWTINFFTSGIGIANDFFDYEHLESSDRLGLTGVRRGGTLAPDGAFTFQHLVMSQRHVIHDLARARVIDPQGEFIPNLYGTVLLAQPTGRTAFLLRGTTFPGISVWPNGPTNWTRSGGPAKPVIEGANIPYFPQGGLHFDQVIPQVPEPGDTTVSELEARDRSVMATISNRPVIVVARTDTALAVDDQVLLTDAANNIGIFTLLAVVVANGTTRIRLAVDAPGVGPAGIRLRALGAPDPAEALSQTTEATHLELQGSAGNYQVGNALRLSQAATEVGVVLVEAFEARLSLDEAVPDPFDEPIAVHVATQSAPIEVTRKTDDFTIEYDNIADLPSVDDNLIISGNGNTVRAIVTGINGQQATVDASLTTTGNIDDKVDVMTLSRANNLGQRTASREAAAQISYTPSAIRSAPTTGTLWLEDNSGRIAIRFVTGRVYDALVADRAIPGNTAIAYDVERIDVTGFDQDGLSITNEQVISLDENVALGNPPALMIQELATTAAGITTGTSDANWVNAAAGSVSKQFTGGNNPPNLASPAEAIVINDGATTEVRRVLSTRVSLQLDRELELTAGADANLKLVNLSTTVTDSYQGRVVGPIQLKFTLPAHGLAVNDNVSVNFSTTAATQTLEYRVTGVNAGNTLTVAEGQPHEVDVTDPGGAVLAATVEGEQFISVSAYIAAQLAQLPRLAPESVVAVEWDNANVNLKVVAVNADVVTFADQDAVAGIHDLYIKAVTVQKLEPANPGSGTPWLAINGQVVNGAAGPTPGMQITSELMCNLWSANDISKGDLLAIADGERTHPCRVLNPSDMDVEVSFDRNLDTAVTPVTLEDPSILRTGFALDFVQEDRAIIIRDTTALFTVVGNPTVLITPMVAAAEGIRLINAGRIGPGTLLVPQDPEKAEINRDQSLIDHELIHTRQSASWGPLFLAWFPLFALEGLYEGVTDIEEPDFSVYVSARLLTVNSTRFIHITEPGGVSFATGDYVQVFANSTLNSYPLGNAHPEVSNQFAIVIGNEIADQDLRIRKVQNDSAWATTRDVFYNIQQVLTHGGMLNTVTGSVYGGLFHLIARCFYALGRLFDKGARYAAEVVDGGNAITINDAAGVTAMNGANRIIIQQGEATFVRPLRAENPVVDNQVHLSAAFTAVTGNVFVAPYSTHTPDTAWDWNSYYPAQVPNLLEPSAIQLFEASAGDSLSLSPFDRVLVASGNESFRTNVTHVRNDGIVELEKKPPFTGPERNLRIAKIDEGDPMGNADSIALRELGFGWMRWLFDPYGQFQYRLQPDNSSFWGILARIVRYLFGSTSWSAFPALGYYLWDNLFVQPNEGHFSQMEQEASEESGELYSPIGRLRGDFSKNDDNARYRGVVGDIARYWYFIRDPDGSVLLTGMRDTPGTHFTDTSAGTNDALRIITDVTTVAPATSGPPPNSDAASSGVTAGLVLPDHFFYKNLAAGVVPSPYLNVTVNGPTGFAPGDRGFVPVSATLERTQGMYAAFSRPGSHRITVANNVWQAQDGVDAQEASHTLGFGHQTLYFNIDISDVDVNVAGTAIASTLNNDGAGNFLPASIQLVQLQRARVTVAPNASRQYAITIPHSGRGGQLLTNGTDEIVAMNRDTPANTPETVEITRRYQKDAAGSYDNAVLNAHNGIHITNDLHIPVRSLLVNVVSTLPVRNAVDLDPANILDINQASGKSHPGDVVFIIIPVDIVNAIRLDTVIYPVVPAMVTNPSPPRIEAEATPESIRTFVGDGAVSKITFQADNPPEITARVTLTVTVGYEELRADLTAEVEVIPYVTLSPVAGLTVQNNGATIALTAVDESNAAVNLLQDSIRLLEPNYTTATGLEAVVNNSTVTITATAAATIGRKQILVKKDSAEEHWAKLTFEVIA